MSHVFGDDIKCLTNSLEKNSWPINPKKIELPNNSSIYIFSFQLDLYHLLSFSYSIQYDNQKFLHQSSLSH